MRISVVILSLVPPVKPVSTVSADKQDRSTRFLCNYISFDDGAFD